MAGSGGSRTLATPMPCDGLAPATVISMSEETGSGIGLELDTGTIVIHPAKEEVFVEIAELGGFADGRWMARRPREDSFEDRS